MRQPTFGELEYESKKRKTRREIFLERMDGLIPWGVLEELIRPYYPKAGRGRRPYELSAMLRIHCVQLFYNPRLREGRALSDPGMEDLLYEAESVRRFVGLRLSDPLPEETTILNFPTSAGRAPVGAGTDGGDQPPPGIPRAAAAGGDHSGRQHHRGTVVDEEWRWRARPTDASDEEGKRVALRYESDPSE